jgi:hypothetical protein
LGEFALFALNPPLRSATWSLLLVGAAGVLSAPRTAFADEVLDRCVDANTHAQALRRFGKLGAARDKLRLCADASCPSLVRDDCTQLLDDLDRAQPTIVFDAKDELDHDLTDVKVQMDGRPFADRLDGMALAADPGEHTFTFEAAGRPPMTQRIVLREGEKGRRERIVLGGGAEGKVAGSSAAAARVPATSSAPSRGPSEGIGTQRVFALAAAGAGLVGLGVGAIFALLAKTKSDDANSICPGHVCSMAPIVSMNHDAVTLGNAATAAVVAGAASLGAGAVLWWTAKPPSNRPSGSVGLGPGTLVVRGTW